VHHAHLILGREALETLGLEKLIFIPAAASPYKTGWSLAAAEVRLEMLGAAIEGIPEFLVDDIELRRPPPSYTIETIAAYREREPGAELYFLVGEDHVGQLFTWHRFAELRDMVHFVVLDRTGIKIDHPYTTIRRHLDISATEIRKRVATGRSIRYLVPQAVEKIIRDRHLYTEPER
jgi:nicotinate-nucleotide adenylyltransferase